MDVWTRRNLGRDLFSFANIQHTGSGWADGRSHMCGGKHRARQPTTKTTNHLEPLAVLWDWLRARASDRGRISVGRVQDEENEFQLMQPSYFPLSPK